MFTSKQSGASLTKTGDEKQHGGCCPITNLLDCDRHCLYGAHFRVFSVRSATMVRYYCSHCIKNTQTTRPDIDTSGPLSGPRPGGFANSYHLRYQIKLQQRVNGLAKRRIFSCRGVRSVGRACGARRYSTKSSKCFGLEIERLLPVRTIGKF